jgi:hypothetical protein
MPEVCISGALKIFRKIKVSALYRFRLGQDTMYFVKSKEINVRVCGIVSVIK